MIKTSLRLSTALALLAASILVTPSASAWNDGANIAVSVFNGTSTGRSEARWMSLDNRGNILSAGIFNGTVDFDPGVGVANLTSAGDGDIFVSKLDSSGNYLWAKRMGGMGYDDAASITTDKDGSVVTTGGFTGTVDFDPGVGVANLTSTGGDTDILVRNGAGADIFVSKLDSSGNYLWAKRMGGVGFDHGIIPAVDRDGNIAVTGFFSETADFDPGERVFNLTSVGSVDIFVSKFDSAGNFIWAKGVGSTGIDGGGGITFDSTGNIYVSGDFSEAVDFDPGIGVTNLTSAGGTDVFISKFDSAGNFIWARNVGGTSDEGSSPNVLDSSGNIYLTGLFKGTGDFDPGIGVTNLTSKGDFDGFVLKLDSSGNYIWAKGFGSTALDEAFSVSVDGNGGVLTTGTFPGTVDFDPGDGSADLTPAGSSSSDAFILKLDSSGNYLWAKQIGGTGSDRGYANVVDQTGMIYFSGVFSGTADFDPGVGTKTLTSSVGRSIFISKLDSSGNVPLVAAVSTGTAPDSKVATIPSGGKEAAISATSALPAIKLNFGGTVPTAVTVVPVLTNPAPSSATPFTISDSIKIVDITLSSPHDGSAVTVCLGGGSADRLFHYTNGAWVELGSRSYVNGQVCGVTTSFSPFVAAPALAPVYVAPTPVPYLKTLTSPKLNLKEGKLVCTPGTYNSGYTLDGVIQGSPTAIFSPSIYTYNLLINGVAQTSKIVTSASTSTSWELQAIPAGSLVACSATVSANSLTNTDKSSDNTAAVSSALTTQSQAIKAAEASYSESISANSKAYQRALVDNRATWRKEIETIQSNYNEALNRIKAKGGPKVVSETSAALKLRIAASKKSAADYAASKPAALAAKDAANKVALDAKTTAIAKANLNYGTFIESIGYGVLIP
jgi:hypothetical protein